MDLSDTFLSDLLPDRKHVRALKIVLLVALSYPFYLLTCYMAAKGFYAHEMFSSIVGLVVPILFMALVFAPLLLLFMVLFWGGILAVLNDLLARVWGEEPGAPAAPLGRTLKEAAGLLVLNGALLGVLVYALYTGRAAEIARPLQAVIFGSLGLGVALVMAARVPPTGRIAALTLLLLAALFVPLFSQENTTSLVETILTQFRLGGVMVTVVPNESGQEADRAKGSRLYGRLVFLSSSNLYLEAECPRKLMIVPRQGSLRLEFAEIRTAGLKEFRCEGTPPPQGDSRR
jgi:hypothetical protein